MSTKLLMSLMSACLVASSGALAESSAMQNEDQSSQLYPADRSQPTISFERMDKDDDGELTRAEAAADKNLARHFSAIAGDDRLSKSEYTAWVKTGSSGKDTHKETGKVDKGSYGTFKDSDLDTGGPIR